jgi:hypothetical protein
VKQVLEPSASKQKGKPLVEAPCLNPLPSHNPSLGVSHKQTNTQIAMSREEANFSSNTGRGDSA